MFKTFQVLVCADVQGIYFKYIKLCPVLTYCILFNLSKVSSDSLNLISGLRGLILIT